MLPKCYAKTSDVKCVACQVNPALLLALIAHVAVVGAGPGLAWEEKRERRAQPSYACILRGLCCSQSRGKNEDTVLCEQLYFSLCVSADTLFAYFLSGQICTHEVLVTELQVLQVQSWSKADKEILLVPHCSEEL